MANEDEDKKIIERAKKRFLVCEEWEAEARSRFDYDYKFANGDAHNLYQWDNVVLQTRQNNLQPILTINKTQQHNLMIINDAKQNKPGVNVRPIGENASFEAAQIFQEVVRHIEYISNAENIYDWATTFQVQAGWGYWRIVTEYISPKSFDQEIYIRRIKDPRAVYLDPNINEIDGSDARFGFIFEDMPKDLYDEKYPDFKDVGWSTTFNNKPDTWLNQNMVRVAEYFEKEQKRERFISFVIPEQYEGAGTLIEDFWSNLPKEAIDLYNEIKKRESNLDDKDKTARERESLNDSIMWYKIAGDKIIDRSPWLGMYIPIVRLIGTETVIDNILDRKGHTRALINPQQIYNYNASANVEYGALQTKAPWLAPARAIEGFEEYYKTANQQNHSYLPYNHMDDDGNPIPAPSRPSAPQASPAYVEQLKIAQDEMMMVSGQYQAQFGENENAKSGIAINARQRQGDRATYHFIDNQAIAIRFTGKILIDLIPKIYDTKRVIRISASDGSIMNVTIDTNAPNAYQKVPPQEGQEPVTDKSQQMAEIIFNPLVGLYDVIADTGPSFATRRQEAFNALTQIAAQNKEFMQIAGDVLWKVADFPEAQVLAERWRKIIPPNITGDQLNPAVEQQMHAAADKIEQQLAIIAKQAKEIADKENQLDIERRRLDLEYRKEIAIQNRLDYEAETKRLTALGNSGPAVAVEQIQPIVEQLVRGMLNAGEPGAGDAVHLPGPHEGGTSAGIQDNEDEGEEKGIEQQESNNENETPPVEGAKKAPDGQWYVPDQNRPGKYMMVANE